MAQKFTEGKKIEMSNLYPKPCPKGGYLEPCPYDHVDFLKWVWCKECSKNSYRCCRYNPKRKSIDTTFTDRKGFTFDFTHDLDSDSDN